jgi:hypothetical protein
MTMSSTPFPKAASLGIADGFAIAAPECVDLADSHGVVVLACT